MRYRVMEVLFMPTPTTAPERKYWVHAVDINLSMARGTVMIHKD
jgi:hypothetical protein